MFDVTDLTNPFGDTSDPTQAALEAQIDSIGSQIDGSPIINVGGGISAVPSAPASDPNSVGGILNGLGGLLTGVSKVITSQNTATGNIPRPVYRPTASGALGLQTAGASGGLILLALAGAVTYFLFIKR